MSILNLPSEFITKDKLKIFISSRIEECKGEREAAKRAVESLNQDPVLFEAIGARPYPPRALYLRNLRESSFVVCIYKDGYGWIDDRRGMTISGLEDEYLHAVEWRIPLFVYVDQDDSSRDPRLRKLVRTAMDGECTVAFYADEEELFSQIKDDLAATLAQLSGFALQSDLLTQKPSEIVTAAIGTAPVFERAGVFAKIKSLTSEGHNILVYGPAGIGKTVTLAEYAKRETGIFISASGLSQKDLLGLAANKLLGRSKDDAIQFATLDGARAGFKSAWSETEKAALVVDDYADLDILFEIIRQAGGPSPDKILIASVRDTSECEVEASLIEMEPLSKDQAHQLLFTLRSTISDDEFDRIFVATGGNPLLLTQSTKVDAGALLDPLEAILDQYRKLTPRARELVTYLSISPVPLSAGDLMALCEGEGYLAEEFFQDIKLAAALVREDVRGYAIFHEKIRDDLLNCIRVETQKFRYFSERVAKNLVKNGDNIRAFFILESCGSESASKVQKQAIRDATRLGDVSSARRLLTRSLEKSIELNDKISITETSIALAQMAQWAGDLKAETEYLKEASRLADDIGDEELSVFVKEYELSSRAQRHMDVDSIGEIIALCEAYATAGRRWELGRFSLLLSSIWIGLYDYVQAEKSALKAKECFEALGDVYGVGLAKRNCAAALMGIPERKADADRLFSEVLQDDDPSDRRARAWLCNLMVRRLREEGRADEALERAREAVDIGKELGDEYIVAINQIGIANALNDMSKLKEALKTYDAAGLTAQHCGRRDIEAQASRLSASVCDDLADISDKADSRDYAGEAVAYAKHAVALLEPTAAHGQKGRLYRQLGDSLQIAGEMTSAIDAYFKAASLLRSYGDLDEFRSSLMTGAYLAIDKNEFQQYLSGISKALGISELAERDTLSEAFFDSLLAILPELDETVAIPVLGLHCGTLLKNAPDFVAPSLVGKILDDAAANPDINDNPWRLLFLALVLCASCPADQLSIFQLAKISELISKKVEGLVYKPAGDGAAFWVVSIDIGRPVIFSIQQIDDRPDTNLATMFLALFLKGFENQIRENILSGMVPARREMAISLGSYAEMPNDLQEILAPHLDDTFCAVTRPSDIADDQLPTFVCCREDIGDEWGVSSGKGGSLQVLLGYTILEIIYAMLHGEVELETLKPKIVSVVRETIS